MGPRKLTLPPEDRLASPYTGWTRAHWEAVADHLLDAVVPYAAPDFAQIRLPGRPGSAGAVCDGLEGYARTFLLAAFRIAGARGSGCDELIERYAAGLAAGTDPTHPYAWPPLGDCTQQLVEAASVAVALHETRPWLFDRLAPAVRDRVVSWLAGFVGKRTWPSNWLLFQVVTEQFLAGVGGPHDPAEIAAGLSRIEDWYVGDGWYSDGAGQNFDYYAGWAMHLYPLLWARMSGDEDRGACYRGRLRDFLHQYQHLAGRDGAPVHQGRSLCYRFGTAAPLWLGALTGASPLSPGRTRRIASGMLRHFVDRGVPDARGLLSLGWYGPFLPCTQFYSGPASPYWASKGFLGLLLPPDHPVWTERESAAPVDDADQVVALSGPGWLLHATATDGVVRVLNHGSDRAGHTPAGGPEDPHYAKLAYASHAAPQAGGAAAVAAVDGLATVLGPDGTRSRRYRIERIGVADRFAASAYTDTLAGAAVRVETAALVRGRYEVRVHRVTAPAGYAVRDGGYALADDRAPDARQGAGWALVSRPDGLTSAVVALAGWPVTEPPGVHRAVQANAYGPCSAVPYLLAPQHPGGSAVYVSLVVLSGDGVHPAALRAGVRVAVDDRGAAVAFPDGEVLGVLLGPRPRYERWPAGGGAALTWPVR